jgi:hypothetical protein
MLTVLGNLRINSVEKLQHLKDSFLSFKESSDNWLINIRGKYRVEALEFLRNELGKRLVEFELLDDKKGWITNALGMLEKAHHEYIMMWNEDHLSVMPPQQFRMLVEECDKQQIDYMLYTWWHFGRVHTVLDDVPVIVGTYLDSVMLTQKIWEQALVKGYPYYLVSLCGIFKKSFLLAMMAKDQKLFPLIVSKVLYKVITWSKKLNNQISVDDLFDQITRLLWYKLPRFSQETPFNIEKRPFRIDMLPFVLGVPKQEVFACIDDNLGVPGYSLVERGLYGGESKN